MDAFAIVCVIGILFRVDKVTSNKQDQGWSNEDYRRSQDASYDNNNATQMDASGSVCKQQMAMMKISRKHEERDVYKIASPEGQCLRIICSARLSMREMSWSSNTSLLNRQDDKSEHGVDLRSLDLRFVSLALPDAGHYTCEGVSSVKEKQMKAVVQVFVIPKDGNCQVSTLKMTHGRAQKEPQRILSHVGVCVRVLCLANNEDIVNLAWEPKFTNSRLHSSRSSAHMSSLELKNVSHWDTGYFTCVARLKNGKIFKGRVHLTIAAKERDTCGSTFFRCATGECMFLRFHCDRILHCPDGSDELNCPGVEHGCRDKFVCANGKCIDTSRVCDHFHTDDCGDMSDEMCILPIHYENRPVSQVPVTPAIPLQNNVPWLNTTVHTVIGITVGVVIVTAAVVIFFYRHKIRQTSDIRRRIAGVRRVRCAVANDYQPPPVRMAELNPFLADYGVNDYGVTDFNLPDAYTEGGNIFLNVNSVHYGSHPPGHHPGHPPYPPSYSDVENTRSAKTPPPPYESDQGEVFGNPWQRRVTNRRASHDYVNVGQQVRPQSFHHFMTPSNVGYSETVTNTHRCQCNAANHGSDSNEATHIHEYENMRGDANTGLSNRNTARDVMGRNDSVSSSESSSSSNNSDFSHIANCSCVSGHTRANSYTDFPCAQATCGNVDYDCSASNMSDNGGRECEELPNRNMCGYSDSIHANVGSQSSLDTISTQPIDVCFQNESELYNGERSNEQMLHQNDNDVLERVRENSTQTNQCLLRNKGSKYNAINADIPHEMTIPPQHDITQPTTSHRNTPIPYTPQDTYIPQTYQTQDTCKTCAHFTRANPKKCKSATYPITNLPKAKYSSAAPYRRPESGITNQRPGFNRNILQARPVAVNLSHRGPVLLPKCVLSTLSNAGFMSTNAHDKCGNCSGRKDSTSSDTSKSEKSDRANRKMKLKQQCGHDVPMFEEGGAVGGIVNTDGSSSGYSEHKVKGKKVKGGGKRGHKKGVKFVDFNERACDQIGMGYNVIERSNNTSGNNYVNAMSNVNKGSDMDHSAIDSLVNNINSNVNEARNVNEMFNVNKVSNIDNSEDVHSRAHNFEARNVNAMFDNDRKPQLDTSCEDMNIGSNVNMESNVNYDVNDDDTPSVDICENHGSGICDEQNANDFDDHVQHNFQTLTAKPNDSSITDSFPLPLDCYYKETIV